MVPALALLIGLGTWQWQRRAWKGELSALIERRAAEVPLTPIEAMALACPDAEAVGLARSCEYRRLRLTGRFDHAGERHVFIALPRRAGEPGGPGYWVMTPFRLAGSGVTAYVNRGFVPENLKEAAQRPEGQVEGEVEIIGRVRSAERRGMFSNQSDAGRNVHYVRDPAELAGNGIRAQEQPATGATVRAMRLGDPGLYIELTGPAPPGGLPLPTASAIRLPNRHLEYALTWWALAATLVGVYGALLAARLRAGGGPSGPDVHGKVKA
jgi:surfeit locus 1 family protein